jgi:hypothetical protein
MAKTGSYPQRPPEEMALEWIRAAAKAVGRLSRSDRELSVRSGELSGRLLAVKDGLGKVLQDWPLRPRMSGDPPDWLPIPPTPGPFEMERAAEQLRTLLGHTIDAIDVETRLTLEGATVRRGMWREGARDEALAELQEFARAHSASSIEEMLVAGPDSIMAVENGLGQIALELYDFLRRDDLPADQPG